MQRREDGVGGDPRDVETEGEVVIQNGAIVLSFPCDDIGDCVVPDRFTGDTNRIEMEDTFLHDGRNLVFEGI